MSELFLPPKHIYVCVCQDCASVAKRPLLLSAREHCCAICGKALAKGDLEDLGFLRAEVDDFKPEWRAQAQEWLDMDVARYCEVHKSSAPLK